MSASSWVQGTSEFISVLSVLDRISIAIGGVHALTLGASPYPLASPACAHPAHEQGYANVKGEGGAVGLTDNPSALRRWMVAGPDLSRMIQEFESSDNQTVENEQKSCMQNAFCKDVLNTLSSFKNIIIIIIIIIIVIIISYLYIISRLKMAKLQLMCTCYILR